MVKFYERWIDYQAICLHPDGSIPSFVGNFLEVCDKKFKSSAEIKSDSAADTNQSSSSRIFGENARSSIFEDGASWSASFLLQSWDLFQYYGDTFILRKHYDGLKQFADWLINTAQLAAMPSETGGRLCTETASKKTLIYECYTWSDWRSPGSSGIPPEGQRINATAYLYHDLRTIANIAEALGETADEDFYRGIAAQVRDDFNDAFLNRLPLNWRP